MRNIEHKHASTQPDKPARPERRFQIGGPGLTLGLLPLFVLGVWAANHSTPFLAFATSLAALLFYAGYSVFVEERADTKIAHHIRRIEAEVQERLSAFGPPSGDSGMERFRQRLQQEISRSQRYELPLAVVILNLAPPDEGPGSDGEAVTSRVVRATADGLRTEDIMGYLGGYEYAFCLPHTNRTGAQIVLERLRHEFAKDEPVAGLAVVHWNEDATPDTLLGRARRDASRRALAEARSESWNQLPAAA